MKNIYLTGMMGSGKTTIGELLAFHLPMRLVDLDAVIVSDARRTIPEIFAEYGEPYFREMESNALHDLSHLSDLIVSTGGGTVLQERNFQLMDHSGLIIYLERDVERIISTIDAASRPLLKADPDNVRRIFHERRPVYEHTAHFRIPNNGTPQEAAERIISHLRREGLLPHH